MGCFCSEDVKQLLHNKYVAVLGDSIQRSVYKDLVKILQGDAFLSENQLKRKGEMSFANDTLVEGGSLSEMHNGVTYREVRQYRTGHHLMRFYFLTRVYSEYVESVLADFKSGPQPDVLIINSCIWDLIRYGNQPLDAYKTNLDCLFHRLKEVLSPECLVIWNMTMPVGFKDGEIPEIAPHNLRWDVVEGNFFSATLANVHKLDVVDMHYHFRFDLRSRCKDAIHWNQLAHRKYTQILLAHIANAWGVLPPEPPKVTGPLIQSAPLPPGFPLRSIPHPHPPYNEPENGQRGFEPVCLNGYTSFDDNDNQMIESFLHGPAHYPVNQMGANAFSPFVDDSPLLVGNFPLRNAGYGMISGINVTVPMFGNHPFGTGQGGGMDMPPEMQFGTFNYNTRPQGPWNGHHRFPRRRDMRQMHPYYRPSPFPTRI